MVNSIDHHDWHSAEYVQEWVTRSQSDDSRRLPRFRLIADLVPFSKDAAIAVLDVGTGYGPLARVLLESFPNARVVAQDYSEEMLRHARGTLASFGNRVAFHKADLFSEGWSTTLGGPFDAVVSSICIHNLQSAPRIRELYKEICSLVNQGGCFLNLDLVSAPAPALQRTYWEMMARERGRRAVDEGSTGSEARGRARSAEGPEPSWPPFPASMEEQLAWLREAGFQHADCFWKEMGLALVGGYK